MLPELEPGQQRAATYLWAATQVAAMVVKDAFIMLYTSLPDSGDGHTSIMQYCTLAGKSWVYRELLDEGYLLCDLTGSPRTKHFLDLKVTKKILGKVLAERFGCTKFGKLMFEVRKLVYLRNDLCHQLLPALTVSKYLSNMRQLKARLCEVTRLASLLSGASHPPDAALTRIHALFTDLLQSIDNPINIDELSIQAVMMDPGTEADPHPPTQMDVQADLPLHPNQTLPMPTTEKKKHPQKHPKEATQERVRSDLDDITTADSPGPGNPQRHIHIPGNTGVTHCMHRTQSDDDEDDDKTRRMITGGSCPTRNRKPKQCNSGRSVKGNVSPLKDFPDNKMPRHHTRHYSDDISKSYTQNNYCEAVKINGTNVIRGRREGCETNLRRVGSVLDAAFTPPLRLLMCWLLFFLLPLPWALGVVPLAVFGFQASLGVAGKLCCLFFATSSHDLRENEILHVRRITFIRLTPMQDLQSLVPLSRCGDFLPSYVKGERRRGCRRKKGQRIWLQ